MPDSPEHNTSVPGRLAAGLQAEVEARAREVKQLHELHELLAKTNRSNLELHRRTLRALAEMKRELQQARRTLRRLTKARL